MEENQIKIPEGWAKQKGDNLFKVQGGYAFKSNDYKDEGVLLVRISNVGNNNFIYKDLIYVPKRFLTSHSNFLLDKDDVLMGLTGDLGKICILENGEFPFILNQRVGRFIFNEKANNRFLYYLISTSTIQNKFDAFFTGGAQKNISPKQIESVEYIVPKSTSEQQSIANILSKTDQAIAHTEALIAKYTRIKTGLMQDLLTKGIDENGNIRSEHTHEFKDSPLGRIPKEWECVKFGENIELVHGYQFRNYDFTLTGIPIIKIGQVKENGIDLSNCSFINPNRIQLFTKQTINNGDVLMALTGATLGKACMVSGLNNPVMQNYRVGRFEPIFENDVDKSFLFFTLKSALFLAQIFNNVNEAAQGNVGKYDFIKSYFIKPSINEQLKIVKHIEKVFNLVDDFNLELSKLQSLKTGLMQDLLSGKVRTMVNGKLLMVNDKQLQINN